MSKPAGLTRDEADAWEKLTRSVKRLDGEGIFSSQVRWSSVKNLEGKPNLKKSLFGRNRNIQKSAKQISEQGNLDGHWERKFRSGKINPDYRLDLHGYNLDQAYNRLIAGLCEAQNAGARVLLIVTGRPRKGEPADRGGRRGAIRAKILDWLAASEHRSLVAAVRSAHPRHGGIGALYLVLRRTP